MRYILFVRESCPFCVEAQNLLQETGAEYSVINFDENQNSILQEVKNAYDWNTVPMIFQREGNNINFIGGYTDLVGSLNNER